MILDKIGALVIVKRLNLLIVRVFFIIAVMMVMNKHCKS